VAATLRDMAGEALGEPIVVELSPGEWRQTFDVLSGFEGREAVTARIDVLSPEGRVWCYASVIDRGSRDPTTIPMRRVD
jgi:hypothetical protein